VPWHDLFCVGAWILRAILLTRATNFAFRSLPGYHSATPTRGRLDGARGQPDECMLALWRTG
jgi:hypothetical protein